MTSEQTKLFVSRCSKLLKGLHATSDEALVREITVLKSKMKTHLNVNYWKSCERSYARENDLAYCEDRLKSVLSSSKLSEISSKRSNKSHNLIFNSNAQPTEFCNTSSLSGKPKIRAKLGDIEFWASQKRVGAGIGAAQSEPLSLEPASPTSPATSLRNSTGSIGERRSLASSYTPSTLSVATKTSNNLDSAASLTSSETQRSKCIRRKLQPIASTSPLSPPRKLTTNAYVSPSAPSKAHEKVTKRESMYNDCSRVHASQSIISPLDSRNKPLPRLPGSKSPSCGPNSHFVELPRSRRSSVASSSSWSSRSSSLSPRKISMYSSPPLIPARKLTTEELAEYSAVMDMRVIASRNQTRVYRENRKKERWEAFKNVRVTVRY